MTYSVNKIVALGEKIKTYCKPRNLAYSYIDPYVRGEDLRHNLASILACAAIETMVKPVTSAEIESIIVMVNSQEGITYSFDYFFKMGWIRKINGRFHLPALVQSGVLAAEDPTRKPDGSLEEEKLRALIPVGTLLNGIHDIAISRESLENIINQYSPLLTIEDLEKWGVLEVKSEGFYKLLTDSIYFRQLVDRIAAVGWQKLVEGSDNVEDFMVYVDFLQMLGGIPKDLSTYLPDSAIKKIKEFSFLLLTTEEDLMAPERESVNCMLDHQRGKIRSLGAALNIVDLQVDDPYLFWRRLENCYALSGSEDISR